MRNARIALFGGALALLVPSTSFGQAVTERVSVDSSGAQENGSSGSDWNDEDRGVAVSADGLRVAFASKATNLVANDTNQHWDVFVRDRAAGTTERVSVDSAGVEADADSGFPALSADGRYVAFFSYATNLVASDTNYAGDIFVHDRATGTTERVSVDSAGMAGDYGGDTAAISADGRYVAFASFSTNLVVGDTNGKSDVFVHDRSSGTTERVSIDTSGGESDGASTSCAISADGNVVAFLSLATNLVAGDTNGFQDVFVHDRTSGATERVNVDSSGNEADAAVYERPAISGDGAIVAFRSLADDLVAGDANRVEDVFVHDRNSGATERVSVDSTGHEANEYSSRPAISADGRRVVFESWASNLVSGDKNRLLDVFVHDRGDGVTECVSVAPSGATGMSDSLQSAISADGQVVAFSSNANNLVSGDTSGWDVFARELCVAPATWANYGAGFPGTFGVPTFTARSFPAIGSTVALDVANSSGTLTPGVVYAGFQRASLHTSLGGDLLLLPSFGVVVVLTPAGFSLAGSIPRDETLCGTAIELQTLEVDAGAAKGVSFTPGLELQLGH